MPTTNKAAKVVFDSGKTSSYHTTYAPCPMLVHKLSACVPPPSPRPCPCPHPQHVITPSRCCALTAPLLYRACIIPCPRPCLRPRHARTLSLACTHALACILRRAAESSFLSRPGLRSMTSCIIPGCHQACPPFEPSMTPYCRSKPNGKISGAPQNSSSTSPLVIQAQTNEPELKELRRVRDRSKVLEGEYAALQRWRTLAKGWEEAPVLLVYHSRTSPFPFSFQQVC